MRVRRVYLDSSAYVGILLQEKHAAKAAVDAAGAELLSSVLLALETRRTLIRLAREGTLSTDAYEACLAQLAADLLGFELRDFTLDLCTGPLPAVATPRSMDLAHLRTALWFHQQQPLDRFVSLDAAQLQAGRELGLPV
jgi:hypothetical protein